MQFADMSETKKIWLVALGYWLAVSLVCCLAYPLMMSDATARYAPMADHFARGEWDLAFHPKFGVLFQVFSGTIAWALGVSGDKAVQIAALGLLAFASVPLYFLVKDMFGEKVAWWAVAFLLLSDDFTRNSFDGLRESAKCLGFALLGYGMASKKSPWFGLGIFVLIASTSYGFGVGSALAFCGAAYFLLCRGFRRILPVIAGWTLGTASVVAQTYAFTGHWLPSPHYIKLLGGWL